jgi:putative transposase
MSKKRRQHNPEFKAKVALEALKGITPIQALAAKYEIHPTQITTWKQELLVQLPAIFTRKGAPDPAEAEEREARLFQKIGQLEVELDWLKKKSAQLHD